MKVRDFNFTKVGGEDVVLNSLQATNTLPCEALREIKGENGENFG
jgi:hypothetical protein